jgi:hypothetical protein
LSRRPDYIQRRIDLETQKRRHRAAAAPCCRCIYCLTSAELDALFQERIRLERLLAGPPPF